MTDPREQAGTAPVEIRPMHRRRDLPRLRECVIALQDQLRRFDARMPTGAEIADEYIAQACARCDESAGAILIATEAAQNRARGHGTRWLRIGAPAADDGTRKLYLAHGFSEFFVVLKKDLTNERITR